MQRNTLILVFGLLMIFYDVFGQRICPECICPVEYNPICGRQNVTNKLRGFTSICVMNCSNQCRKNKFEFYKKGRCGRKSRNRVYTVFGTNQTRSL